MRALCLLALGLYRIPYTRPQGATGPPDFQFGMSTAKPTTTLVFYAPNPGLDPYWPRGEWVFGRTASEDATTRTTPKRYDRFLVCGRPCARVFRKLTGKVCVHKLDNVYQADYAGRKGAKFPGLIDWRLGGVLDRNEDYLRSYPSYCAFLDAQCRTDVAHGYGFAFLHMGSCVGDDETWPNLLAGKDVRSRKRVELYKYHAHVLDPGKTLRAVVYIIILS